MAAQKKKKPITSLKQVAKRYGGKEDKSGYMPGSYGFKNFGLEDLAEAIWQKSTAGYSRVGVYINKKQAARYADVVNYAKKLGVEVGVAKAGIKNRPYDILVGAKPGSTHRASTLRTTPFRTETGDNGVISSTTPTAATDTDQTSIIANKIINAMKKKKSKFGQS